MGYAIEMHLVAQDQVQALPSAALLSFAEAITVVEICSLARAAVQPTKPGRRGPGPIPSPVMV